MPADADLSTSVYEKASFACAVVIVALCALGAVGNLLSLYIFTRRNFRQYSINVLLAALSAVDTCLLVLAVPVFTAVQFAPLVERIVDPDDISNLVLWIYPLTLMFQCGSVWLLVVITVERYIAVCHPFAVTRYLTR